MLQVLLSAFGLERIGDGHLSGVHLTAQFDDATHAIWRRQQRRFVQDSIDKFEVRAEMIDKNLAEFLSDANASTWKFSDPPFVFRYGNGGTLPILRLGDREYYCLAYRDIDPIGWNLANGASDSRHELLNPLNIIERELREEILIVDEAHGVRYALQWEDDDVLERPEFMLAREYWRQKRGIDIGGFEERIAPVTWIHGPDAITIKTPRQLGRSTTGIFLNISAVDFGVELDRIAKIHVEDGAIVLDGETLGSRLVDRPIGLFEINRFAETFRTGSLEFIPDILFVSGDRFEATPEEIAARLAEACSSDNRPLRSESENEEWEDCVAKLVLCPVTRQLVARHLAQEARLKHDHGPARRGRDPYSVFISSTGHDEDLGIAQKIYTHLSSDPNVGPVFFYKETPKSMDWLRAIEDALLSADSLIIVCTDTARVRSLDFEWQPFFIWTRYGRKDTGQIVPVLHGVHPHDLPLPLCTQDPVLWSPGVSTPLEVLSRKVTYRYP